MQGFVICVVTSVSLLQQKGPQFKRLVRLSHLANIDVEWHLIAVVVSDGRNEVIYNHIFPHILLKNFHQIHPIIVSALFLKHFIDEWFAVFDGSEGISYKIIALFPLITVYLNIAAGTVEHT